MGQPVPSRSSFFSCSWEEPYGIDGTGCLWAECPFCHQTYSVTVLTPTSGHYQTPDGRVLLLLHLLCDANTTVILIKKVVWQELKEVVIHFLCFFCKKYLVLYMPCLGNLGYMSHRITTRVLSEMSCSAWHRIESTFWKCHALHDLR